VQQMHVRMKNWLLNALLVAASLGFALILGEVALRIIGYSNPVLWTYDDITGSRLYPGAEGWFRNEGESYVKVNSDGLRDREHDRIKPANTFRVAVLGDSMTEALQVPQESSYWTVLESALGTCKSLGGRKVEVINFGVSGYGTAQALLTYRHRASAYAPDVVVLGLYAGNDIRNNSKELEPNKLRPFFRLDGGELVLDTGFLTNPGYTSYRSSFDRRRLLFDLRMFQLTRQLKSIVEQWKQAGIVPASEADLEAGSDNKIFLSSPPPAWEAAWKLTERLLVAMRNEVAARGARFVVVSIPIGIQAYPDPAVRQQFVRKINVADLWYPDRRISAFSEREHVDAITLGQRFQSYAEQNGVYLYGFRNTRLGTGHLNENGHKLVGEALAQRLCASAEKGHERESSVSTMNVGSTGSSPDGTRILSARR
jgi:hypothetical protein